MTVSYDPLLAVRGDLQLLSCDLACVCGALREVETVWRRAHEFRPELPLSLPVQLEDATRELAASAGLLVDAGFGQPPDLAFSMAAHWAALRRDISKAAVMTGEAGSAQLGDSRLWSYIGAAMHRAGNRLLALIVQLARIEDWSLKGPGAELPGQDRAWLLVQLG
jgi:hypothetical protein